MDTMTHTVLHLGLDPASQLFGVCWFDQSGSPLMPVKYANEVLRSFVTLKSTKSGKDNRNIRLDELELALRSYIETFPNRYFRCLDWFYSDGKEPPRTWEIGSIGIEQPSDKFGKDRHDTSYVNGMSARMAYTVCRDYVEGCELSHSRKVKIHEIMPSESSQNLGLTRGAAKWQRCTMVATLGGGQYVWPEMNAPNPEDRKKYASDGWCEGGLLDGANADALDAGAAAWSARHHYINDGLLQLANQSTKKGQRHDRARRTKQPP